MTEKIASDEYKKFGTWTSFSTTPVPRQALAPSKLQQIRQSTDWSRNCCTKLNQKNGSFTPITTLVTRYEPQLPGHEPQTLLNASRRMTRGCSARSRLADTEKPAQTHRLNEDWNYQSFVSVTTLNTHTHLTTSTNDQQNHSSTFSVACEKIASATTDGTPAQPVDQSAEEEPCCVEITLQVTTSEMFSTHQPLTTLPVEMVVKPSLPNLNSPSPSSPMPARHSSCSGPVTTFPATCQEHTDQFRTAHWSMGRRIEHDHFRSPQENPAS